MLKAAASWKDESEDCAAVDCSALDESFLATYTQRLRASKTAPHASLSHKFARLCLEFEHPHVQRTTTTMRIDGNVVHFSPLNVEPGRHFEDQGACFAQLTHHWQRTAEQIDELVVDLSGATTKAVADIMAGVHSTDVVRGIRIWETLPCRIHKIVVLPPTHKPMWWLSVRGLVPLFLSAKLRRKLVFT